MVSATSFSFACSACGKCCNSPPSMTLAELFRHRERFIGCIAIGHVPRKRVGECLRVGKHESVLDETDIAAFDHLADTLLYHAGGTFSITAQGYDYPSLGRCPALADDGRCAIHLHGKPLTCEVVPLDPLVPDRLQHIVLAARNQSAGYIGADCIHEGSRDGAAMLVEQRQVVDGNALGTLMRRRQALAMERDVWGLAVFNALSKDLFDSPAALARIPAGGFLTISLVPALLTVAAASELCRDACIDYIDSQLALIERSIAQALLRRRLDERPVTQELRGFANAYRQAKAALAGSAHHAISGGAARAVEAYLVGAWRETSSVRAAYPEAARTSRSVFPSAAGSSISPA